MKLDGKSSHSCCTVHTQRRALSSTAGELPLGQRPFEACEQRRDANL